MELENYIKNMQNSEAVVHKHELHSSWDISIQLTISFVAPIKKTTIIHWNDFNVIVMEVAI